jgi:hypothetical protein
MPTWRTTLGRALTPGKTPNIGQARELPMPSHEIHAIPWREDLAIRPIGDPLPVYLVLPPAPVTETNYAVFRHPGPVSVLAPSDHGRSTPAGPAGRAGRSLNLSPGASLDQMWERAAAPQAPDVWDWILPLVEPPAVGPTPAPQLGDNRLRPYQVEGVRQIVLGRSILLADELGLGKTVQASTAMYSLVQRGLARRVLVVCSTSSLRHWLAHLQAWAPGLLVCLVRAGEASSQGAWTTKAHVYLTDHSGLIAGPEGGALPASGLTFDLVVLDDLVGARREGERLWEALDQLQAPRRLALTGAPAGSEDFWLSVFGFLFPQPEAPEGEARLMTAQAVPSPISILRRTRAEVGKQLPERSRIELWIDLHGGQREAYREAIAEERRRLAGLGDAVSSQHIQAALDRLVHAANYGPDPGEGAKVKVLGELLDDIAASGSKAFVVVNDRKERLGALLVTLERFGIVTLDVPEVEVSGSNPVERFRSDPEIHVLLGGVDQVDDMSAIPELSYIFHVDPHWNPAVRRRVDDLLQPEAVPGSPVIVYELWSAATLEARLHDFMMEKARFTGGATSAAAELSRDDWLEQVIEIGKAASASGAPLQWTSDAETPSEVLPDKKLVTGMDPTELAEGVTDFIHALGFPDIEQLFGNSQAGVDLLAWREAEGRIERILVRCLTEEGNVGVADTRLALDLLDEHPDISRAYLVGTGDFSAAAKKTAEESVGRLELISGSELARHLRLLRKLPDDHDDPAG